MTNFFAVPDVKFIAGVTFQSEYGVHEAGSEVKEAMKFSNLQVLVDSHFLYPYAPDNGYEFLPPHLFNAVRTKDETISVLEGDPSGTRAVVAPKSDLLDKAEAEAEAQNMIRDQIRTERQPGNTPEKTPEDEPVKDEPKVEEPADKPVRQTAKKTVAKKAAPTKESNNG